MKLFLALIMGIASVSANAIENAVAKEVTVRQGTGNFISKLKAGKSVTGLGGSADLMVKGMRFL